jgi:hypothetical protein
MTWKELARFAAAVPPSFADEPVTCHPMHNWTLPPVLIVREGVLDDRGPSLTVKEPNE